MSFYNWKLNTLSKDDCYRIIFLGAHNANFYYDIISFCGVNLTVHLPENILPGYIFHKCNHPDGNMAELEFYMKYRPIRISNTCHLMNALSLN